MIHILQWAFIQIIRGSMLPSHTFTILDHPEACPTGASHRACPCGESHPPASDVSWWAPDEPLLLKTGRRWATGPDRANLIPRCVAYVMRSSTWIGAEQRGDAYAIVYLITSKRMNTFFGCKDVGKTWNDYVFAPNWFIQYKIHTCITVVDIIYR